MVDRLQPIPAIHDTFRTKGTSDFSSEWIENEKECLELISLEEEKNKSYLLQETN
jgi:hypothetical protein